MLIAQGAGVNLRNNGHETALHFAGWTGQAEVCEVTSYSVFVIFFDMKIVLRTHLPERVQQISFKFCISQRHSSPEEQILMHKLAADTAPFYVQVLTIAPELLNL